MHSANWQLLDRDQKSEPRRFRRAPYFRAIQRGLEFDLWGKPKWAFRCSASSEVRARDLIVVRALTRDNDMDAPFLLCRLPSIPEITNVIVGREYARRLAVH